MKRWRLVLTGIALLAVFACKKEEQTTADAQQPYEPPPMEATGEYDDPYATQTYSEDPYAGDTLVTSGEPVGEEVVVAANAKRTHVVEKGDTLYKLARQYYNDQSKWRRIWDANRSVISDPDKLQVGTRLAIP